MLRIQNPSLTNKLGRVGIDIILLAASGLMFVLSFPSFLDDDGFFWLAYITFVPLWLVCFRIDWRKALIYGPLYGFFTYMAFNFWLKTFDPEAFVLVPFLYAGYMLLFFQIFVALVKFYPQRAHWLLPIAWLAYEVIRTKGFAAYAYGQIGSSQYLQTAILGIADLGGQLLVSALVVFPSSTLAWLLQRKFVTRQSLPVRAWLRPLLIYALVFALALGYTYVRRVDYRQAPRKKIALIQHNINSWLQAADIYSRAFSRLKTQTLAAVDQGAELVIWSETAFVPSYEYLLRVRPSQRQVDLDLALQLQELLRQTPSSFILGLNDNVPEEEAYYNSAVLVENGEIIAKHRKHLLVPLSENIPFRQTWPALANAIQQLVKSSPYTPGGDPDVLRSTEGISYAALICFEDTFPMLARTLTRKGADVLVNITNDSWSPAAANTNQHFASALLRAVENRRFLVRTANSGVTTVVDPNGKILARLPINTEGTLMFDLPVDSRQLTIFTRFGGPLLELAAVVVTAIALLWGWRKNVPRRR